MKYYKNFFDFIDQYNRLILTSHENPDADAIASEYAMCRYLISAGYDAEILTCEILPDKYKFIDPENIIKVITSKNQLPEDLNKCALIVLDTNNPYNTGMIFDLIKDQVKDMFIIDHHEKESSTVNDQSLDLRKCIETDASSTCEIVYNILRSKNFVIDKNIAQAIFSGILYDTGFFVFPKTSYKTFQAASELLKAGADQNYIYSCMYETNSLSSLKLQAKVFSEIEFYHNNKIALQIMTNETVQYLGAKFEDGDTIINLPMKCRDILVSVFFKENDKNITRCSIRSKNNIDIASIAIKFGGGGHTTAAGFKCQESIEIVKEKVLKDIIKILK